MARYIREFQVNADPQTVQETIYQYLQSEGYEYTQFDGENVFKKGNGIMSGPTLFKFTYSGNMVRMETWMKYAFLPGVYVGELGVTGFVGSAAKGPWKNRINYLENTLNKLAQQNTYYDPASVQGNSNTFENNETQPFNNYNNGFAEASASNEDKAEPVGENASIICNGCGSQMPEGSIFCTVCGQKFSNTDAQSVTPQSSQPYQQFDSQTSNYAPNGTPLPPAGYPVSRKEFIEKYAQPSLRKNIKNIAILCYICSGLTIIVSCLFNPIGIIDGVILLGLALGMHLAKSKVCAILILILSIIEVVVAVTYGGFPFWWLIAGIAAVVTFNNIEKQYKSFIANGNR